MSPAAAALRMRPVRAIDLIFSSVLTPFSATLLTDRACRTPATGLRRMPLDRRWQLALADSAERLPSGRSAITRSWRAKAQKRHGRSQR